jgi:hypothetical protein
MCLKAYVLLYVLEDKAIFKILLVMAQCFAITYLVLVLFDVIKTK